MRRLEDILAQDGILVYGIKGKSMKPMLRPGRDAVIIKPPECVIKKNDVVLYKHDNAYVLHRVIDVKNPYYLIRGDNTYSMELVPASDVKGILVAFRHGGRDHTVSEKGYRFYVRFWNIIYPVRLPLARLIRIFKKAANRAGISSYLKRLLKHE